MEIITEVVCKSGNHYRTSREKTTLDQKEKIIDFMKIMFSPENKVNYFSLGPIVRGNEKEDIFFNTKEIECIRIIEINDLGEK